MGLEKQFLLEGNTFCEASPPFHYRESLAQGYLSDALKIGSDLAFCLLGAEFTGNGHIPASADLEDGQKWAKVFSQTKT